MVVSCGTSLPAMTVSDPSSHPATPLSSEGTPAGEEPSLEAVGSPVGVHSGRLQRIIETQRDIAGADLDLPAIMQLVCERTQELTGADGGTILMRDGEGV